MNADIHAVILTTTVDDDQAVDRLIAALLEPRLAACAQVSPVHSVFWWQGRLQQADESRIQVKLPAARVDAAIAAIRAVHPYEVPEIVVTPILDGNPDYLAWIDAETAPDAHRPPAPSPR